MFVKHRKDIYHIPTDSISIHKIRHIGAYQKAYRERGSVLTDVKHLTYPFAQSTHQMCRHAHSASRKQPVRDMKPAVSRHGKGSSAPENALRSIIRRSPRRQEEAGSTVRQATCRLSISISRFCFVNIFYCQYCINIHFHIILRSYEKPPATPPDAMNRPA